jgi:hypothetical protein
VGMAAALRYRIFCLPPAAIQKKWTLKYAQPCSSEDRASSGLLSMQEGQMYLRVAQRTGECLTESVSVSLDCADRRCAEEFVFMERRNCCWCFRCFTFMEAFSDVTAHWSYSLLHRCSNTYILNETVQSVKFGLELDICAEQKIR